MVDPLTRDLRPNTDGWPDALRVFTQPPEDGRGGFKNPWKDTPIKGFADVLEWQLQRNPYRAAKRSLPVADVHPNPRAGWDATPGAKASWLGHASVLVSIDGVNVLIDPVFGRVFPGLPRLAPAAWSVAELPTIHAVLLSHGHYDHLDAASCRAIAARFPDATWVMPRGLSGSLPRVCRDRVETTWWEAVLVDDVEFCLVPAQHWHRRRLNDINRALWGGWVVRGTHTLYHSGDTGFFGGFEAIGRAFPRIDLAVLPIGAWAPKWFMADHHMDPDGTVEAFRLLGAKRCMPMHWGTFDLTDEPLDEGPRELDAAIKRAGVPPEPFAIVAHGATLAL